MATATDAPSVLEIYGPFCEDSPVSFETRRPTIEEIELRIREVSEMYPWLVYENGNEVIGYAYASPHRERAAYRWSVDIAIYISETHRSRGIGTALYAALFQILRIQGFVNAYAGITLPNPASLRLHERFGFQLVGVYRKVGYKSGLWHDVAWWALTLQSGANPPEEPIPLKDALKQADLRKAIDASLASKAFGDPSTTADDSLVF
jgi:L-amino acid N-acyltransferase YncA